MHRQSFTALRHGRLSADAPLPPRLLLESANQQRLTGCLAVVLLATLLCSPAARAADPFALTRDESTGTGNPPAAESRPAAPRQLFAHPTVPVAPQPVTESPVEQTTVLVLDHGRIAEGRMQQTAAGYIVHRSGGSMLVPHDRVQFRARDRHHAWELQRNTGEDLSPARRVSLARWCLTYELYEEAQTELRAALEEEPSRRDARSMLVRLEGLLNPDAVETRIPRRAAARSTDGFEEPEIRSLAGLSRDSAREFVTVVQPLLVNSCANASCHGSATKSRFRLENVRVGQAGNRILTERNLAAVLDQVNLSDPFVSPLLTVPRNGHGPGGRSVFTGSVGARLQRELEQWTATISAELTGHSVAASSRGRRNTSRVRQTGGLQQKSGYNPFAGIPWNRAGGRTPAPARTVSRQATSARPASARPASRQPASLQSTAPFDGQSTNISEAAALAAFRSGGVQAAGLAMQAQAAQNQPRQYTPEPRPVRRPVSPNAAVPYSAIDRRSSFTDQASPTDVVEQVLTEEQADPFDPAAFNRGLPGSP